MSVAFPAKTTLLEH